MIKLLPFTGSDFHILFSWIDSEELLMQFAGPALHFPLSAEQLIENLDNRKRLCFKVMEHSSQTIIGYSEIFITNKETVLLGRILIGEKEYRGRGYGLQIVNALLEISFCQMESEMAELNVFDWNLGAIACYEKAGFILNPEKVSCCEMKGEIWTAINMILKSEDWKPKKLHFDLSR